MTESISQGIPSLMISKQGIELYKMNDISFTNLKKIGFNCLKSPKKPDQIVAYNKKIIIAIEDKVSISDMNDAVKQIKDNYLSALPDTNFFIARAGDKTKVFFRISSMKMTEIDTLKKGKEVVCFGSEIITKKNPTIRKNLTLLAEEIIKQKKPSNNVMEIEPPKEYHNPLNIMEDTIFSLWQKIFVTTGENASKCLSTFVELLLYKGISDANMLDREYVISHLKKDATTNSLKTYKGTIREYIKKELFPSSSNQPSVINGFAFEEQETTFKSVLKDLDTIGNLADNQLDPDFKRRILEAFLGSAHGEGTIRSGKHLTPRILIQAVWEMADIEKNKVVCDPACGVGGFVLEGLNYPYEYDPLKYKFLGIDRDEQIVIVSKANMVLHILDKFASPKYDNQKLSNKINESFLYAKNNGTGTLGEINKEKLEAKHKADYIFANVPFFINGIKEIDKSLDDLHLSSFYDKCGMGIESRFLKYIMSQIKQGKPGLAFVIVPYQLLSRINDNIRKTINSNADILGIISLPVGMFQNTNWKTAILIFKKKITRKEYSSVFLFNVENIGISLDSYRTPIEENDIPDLKKAWKQRLSNNIDDEKCRFVSRDVFCDTSRWSDLFEWVRNKDNNKISISKYSQEADRINKEITDIIALMSECTREIENFHNSIEVKLGNKDYFKTSGIESSKHYTIKEAKLKKGEIPLFSSKVEAPAEYTTPICQDNFL